MTSLIAAGGSGRSTSVIPAVFAASSVTTMAFTRSLPMEWLAEYLAPTATMDAALTTDQILTPTDRGDRRRRGPLRSPTSRTGPPPPATAGLDVANGRAREGSEASTNDTVASQDSEASGEASSQDPRPANTSGVDRCCVCLAAVVASGGWRSLVLAS